MHLRSVLLPRLCLLGVMMVAGCTPNRVLRSYLPVGASARYGDQTEDGVVVMLRQETRAALQAVTEALESAGYTLDPAASERLRLSTQARSLGGDTTMVVRAEAIPVELPEPATSIVLTATYSVPSRRLHDVAVVERPGESGPLYGRLRAVAAALRKSRTPVP